jgi:single-strand DNA-binding protein
MATFNQATVIGFVGDEPRIIQTQSNTAMASLAIATTERGYQRQDGTQVEDRTEWHNIVFFGKPAEVIGRYVHKGSSLFVQGKMRTRSYEDKDGIKRYVTEIIGDNFQLLDKKTNTSDVQSNNSVSSSQYNGNGYQASQAQSPNNDDLPF